VKRGGKLGAIRESAHPFSLAMKSRKYRQGLIPVHPRVKRSANFFDRRANQKAAVRLEAHDLSPTVTPQRLQGFIT
jgi:hypothetical protein